jgi:sigma-E factor negative regulatory protein RseB
MSFCSNNLVKISTALFLCFSGTYSFADDLFDMLKRMSDADQKQNYQGTFILRKADSLSTLRVTHAVDSNGEWESLESLNGESRKVFRFNDRVISVFPDRKLVTIRHNDEKQSLHQQLPENIDQLAQFYSMKRLDDDRIAKHQTLVVDLIPRDKYRYGYRYWVDKNSGMLLRCDLIDEDNMVVEQMMFTELDYLSAAPVQAFDLKQFEQFEQQQVDEPKVTVAQAPETGWKVGHLPKGFMLTQTTMRYSKPKSAANNNQIADAMVKTSLPDLLHMVYSDGLASVSVFIETSQGAEKHLQGEASMGAMNAYGNAVDGYVVTVVGEVPAKTVQLMAQTMVKLPKD